MNRHPSLCFLLAATLFGAGGPDLALADEAAPNAGSTLFTQAAPAGAQPETRTVVAGQEFDRSGHWRFWFGDGFRKAWATPVEVPVLDLATEAGGLTPLRQVGGLQTEGLAMKGANGLGYTFRKLEKHPERVLPKEWLDSELRGIAVDQTAAAHPAATVIVGHLAQSVEIPFYGSRLAVMPDDPALGPFRETFANAIGTFDEYPAPGYKGITEIISSGDMWEKWREGGPENRVDSRAFLKARLFDLVVGNWDRHQGQWRWARVEGKPLWQPIPEDADQAFTRYEGKAMTWVRTVVPRFMRYKGEYPKRLEGLTTNNYDVTRWMLADVEWPVFEEVARELQARMTDPVIDEAMRQMPEPWYAIDGAQMTKDVRERRDGIVDYARVFYLHLADRVDVRATDRADIARVEHQADGSLTLTLAPLGTDGAPGTPYYQRSFSPEHTKEIRLYMLGGNDRVVAGGKRKGGIHVRVLGDGGNDSVDDSRSGGLDVEDGRGDNEVRRGPGTKVSEKAWTNPAPQRDRPWLEPRNYGHWTVPMIEMWWQPNQAFMVGGGFTRTAWGFRKYPWANTQAFTLLYSTGYQSVRASYTGQWRLTDVKLLGTLNARFSGIENRNFYGFGNETPNVEDKALHMTETNEYRVFPALSYRPSINFELHVGAEAKVVQTKGGDSLVEQEQAYGSGKFGDVEGSVAGYVGSEKLILATRVGGRAMWGKYPWFESASISGTAGNVRGYYDGRYRGDSSLFGNAELRWWIGRRKNAVLPIRWGLTVFAESGRVWYEGEDSKKWHTGYGGGLMLQLVGTPMAFGGSIASGTEGIRFYFSGGYSF